MARKKKSDEPAENGVQTAPPPEANGTEEKKRPEQFFSVAAGKDVYVEAACWPKTLTMEGKDDIVVYAVTVRKSYKDKDGNWQNTQFFRTSELHLVAHVIKLAEAWVLNKRTETKDSLEARGNGGDIPF